MTLYSAKALVAADPAFVARVEIATMEAAVAISNEAPGTANHANRVQLALVVIRNPSETSRRFATGVATNPNVGTGVSDPSVDSADGDSALAFVIASIWDAFAGMA